MCKVVVWSKTDSSFEVAQSVRIIFHAEEAHAQCVVGGCIPIVCRHCHLCSFEGLVQPVEDCEPDAYLGEKFRLIGDHRAGASQRKGGCFVIAFGSV